MSKAYYNYRHPVMSSLVSVLNRACTVRGNVSCLCILQYIFRLMRNDKAVVSDVTSSIHAYVNEHLIRKGDGCSRVRTSVSSQAMLQAINQVHNFPRCRLVQNL
jgi:hypothetical protein